MDLEVKNKNGESVRTVQASDSVWGAEENDSLLHQAVVAQLANRRQGTHDTISRLEAEMSTRKLRAQKHTGRSRLGSRSSPAMGGSVSHGPHPRDYRQELPKKMRRLALRVALSEKVRDNSIFVLDELKLAAPKTKDVRAVIDGLGLKGSTLIVTAGSDQNIVMSAGNIPGVEVLPAALLNPLQAVSARNLVITEDAVKVVDSIWAVKGGQV